MQFVIRDDQLHSSPVPHGMHRAALIGLGHLFREPSLGVHFVPFFFLNSVPSSFSKTRINPPLLRSPYPSEMAI